MNILKVKDKDCMTIALEGRLDTVTAPEMVETVKELDCKELVVDLEKLEYISSAGLRALLVCKKAADQCGASFCVKNPTQPVFEVMRMSGFDKVLTIQRD
ncbi:MAG: hypothetical protein EUB_00665 [Eubacterium sp.]|uniref:Anti-sigma factor antagonist n=1 Tax=Eubacterium maltosivorans TaxID=2041044 RepID=A0A4P9CAB4_EUBML|nr:STAS domain-containing protein [Eubacterium maltosivorans]QCT72519.1 anti-sigma factor antagonist [Eubacterium maltosivorans]